LRPAATGVMIGLLRTGCAAHREFTTPDPPTDVTALQGGSGEVFRYFEPPEHIDEIRVYQGMSAGNLGHVRSEPHCARERNICRPLCRKVDSFSQASS
jgi:hypothetical protein